MGLFDGAGGVAGGIGALTGIASGALGAIMGGQTNIAQMQALGQQESYETQMSNTQYQRSVADMKAAGLNPILAAGGGGAGTPSIGLPSLQAPQVHMPDLMGYGVSMAQLDQAQQRLNNETAQTKATIQKTLNESDLDFAQRQQINQGLAGKTLGTDLTNQLKSIFKDMINSTRMQPSPSQPNMGMPSSSDVNLSPENPY